MSEVLLTIAIPTYNRCTLLERNLKYLLLQNVDIIGKVEIIVSDNASSDNTYEVVNSYISLGLEIRYLKNNENKGADFNIAQCYLNARGRYILSLGDDDLLIRGSIKKILFLIEKDDYGLIFLKTGKVQLNAYNETDEVNYTIYDDPIKFIKRINYYVTFISANIVAKKYLDAENILKYQNSNLIQVPYIMDAILNAPQNVYINDLLLYAEPDNTGGYNVFKIFSENFNKILSELRHEQGTIGEIKRIINDNLLISFFPIIILKLKINKYHDFVEASPLPYLKPLYKNHIRFWLFCYPIVILPNKLAIVYSYFIKVYIKLRRIFIL